jgi:hypothetical protein
MTETLSLSTKDVVAAMLRENTGSHFLDSGGAYGRNWERNQGKSFNDQPQVWWEWSQYKGKLQLSATVSLYHWMVDNLEFDQEMQARLDQFAEENPDMPWLELQEVFAEHEAELFSHDTEPRVINTYNDPDNCDLSQVLQYHELFTEGSYEPTHLVVSVHGGCDVRGGYTAPKCFRLRGDYFEALDTMQARWFGTSDYSWYRDGWNRTEESHNNERKLGRLFSLPAFELDELPEDLQDETDAQFEALLARATYDKAAIKDTSLDEQRMAEAIEQIEAAVKEVEAELRDRRIQRLCDTYDVFVLVENRKAYLYVDGEDDEICVGV